MTRSRSTRSSRPRSAKSSKSASTRSKSVSTKAKATKHAKKTKPAQKAQHKTSVFQRAELSTVKGLVHEYTCRAETGGDLFDFDHQHQRTTDRKVKIETVSIDGDEWTLCSNATYKELTNYFHSLYKMGGDLHVMVQSLKPTEQYDGERDNEFA
jgi:hypothetical protein